MPIPDWNTPNPAENPWDRLSLDGTLITGCRVSVEGEPGRDLDVKGRKGKDGATYTDNGVSPATLDITIECWTKERADFVDSVIERIDPNRGGRTTTPVAIDHPAAVSRGVTSFYVTTVALPKVSRGVCTFKIKGRQNANLKDKTETVGSPARRQKTADQELEAIRRLYEERMAAIKQALDNGEIEPTLAAQEMADANAERAASEQAVLSRQGDPAEASNVNTRSAS